MPPKDAHGTLHSSSAVTMPGIKKTGQDRMLKLRMKAKSNIMSQHIAQLKEVTKNAGAA